MAKLSLLKGSTSVTIQIFIQDSASTTGAGKSGLAFNTAGLTAYYARTRSASAAITLATQTVTGAWSSGGFVEIDPTNMTGWYRLDVPNAVLATGANSVDLAIQGTGIVPLPLEIELTATDNQDAQRFGIAALPATGTLAVSPTINAINGLAPPANWNLESIDGSGRVLLQPTQTGVTIPTVTTVGTATNLTNLPVPPTDWITGTVLAASGVTKIQAGLATPTNITAGTITTVTTATNLTNLPTIPTDWLTATGVRADAVTKIQAGLSTYAGADTPGTTTLLVRLGGALTISGGKVAATVASGDAADAAGIAATIGVAGAGLTSIPYTGPAALADYQQRGVAVTLPTGGVTLAASQPNYAPLTSLGSAAPDDWITGTVLAASAVTAIQAGLSTYAGGDTAGTTTLLSRVTGAVALASQIPANFTTATFASAGVFATAALANAPTGGTAPTAAAIRAEIDANSTQLAALRAGVVVTTNNDKSGYTLAASGLDAVVIETGYTAKGALKVMLHAAAGSVTGNGSTTIAVGALPVPTSASTTTIMATMGGTNNVDRTGTAIQLSTT